MPSPFPGMDPYLERHWGDVHTRLITYSSDQLQTVLPKDLRARVQERVVVSQWEHLRTSENASREPSGAVSMAGMRCAKYPPVCSTKTSVHCRGAVKDMALQVQAMTMLQMQALMAN